MCACSLCREVEDPPERRLCLGRGTQTSIQIPCYMDEVRPPPLFQSAMSRASGVSLVPGTGEPADPQRGC